MWVRKEDVCSYVFVIHIQSSFWIHWCSIANNRECGTYSMCVFKHIMCLAFCTVYVQTFMLFCGWVCRPGSDRHVSSNGNALSPWKKCSYDRNQIKIELFSAFWTHIGLTLVSTSLSVIMQLSLNMTLTPSSLLSPLRRQEKRWERQKLRHIGSAQACRAVKR